MKKLNCNSCGREIKPGEFMAVLAKSPTKEYVGRIDSIINKWVKTTDGAIYCRECFEKNVSYSSAIGRDC